MSSSINSIADLPTASLRERAQVMLSMARQLSGATWAALKVLRNGDWLNIADSAQEGCMAEPTDLQQPTDTRLWYPALHVLVEPFLVRDERWALVLCGLLSEPQNDALLSIQNCWTMITELDASERAMRQREETYRGVLNNLNEVVFQTDLQGKWTYLNQAWTERTGYLVQDSLGKSYDETIKVDDDRILRQKFSQLIDGTCEDLRYQLRYRHKDGSDRWVEVVARPNTDSGRTEGVTGSLKDVTERRRHLEELELGAQVYRLAREGIVITDANCLIIDVNAAFERITGYTRDEVVGKKPSMFSSGRQPPEFYRDMWTKLKGQGYWEGELWNCRKDGRHYAELLTISAVQPASAQVSHYVGVFSDITYLKEHERELEQIALYDALTRLPNRRLLSERMRQAMVSLSREKRHMAVIYVDLDGFKAVNDRYGHATGDLLLCEVAARLSAAVRASDTVCRLGGDEFVILLSGLASTGLAIPSVNRIVQVCAEPFQIEALDLNVSASVGVAFYPQDRPADPDLLSAAVVN